LNTDHGKSEQGLGTALVQFAHLFLSLELQLVVF
jgi:hypothetical protein